MKKIGQQKNDYCFYIVIFVLPAIIMESKAFKNNQFKTRMRIIRLFFIANATI